MLTDPYATGVLKPEHHDRLVADLANYAKDAAIQPQWIWSPLPEGAIEERSYLQKFKQHLVSGATAGLCLIGLPDEGTVEARMSAMAGFLVRNFVRARVMTLGTVLDAHHDGSTPDLSAILIPNFFLSGKEAGSLAYWQVSALFDVMVARHVTGRQTIICVSDLKALEAQYGLAIFRMINTSFVKASL